MTRTPPHPRNWRLWGLGRGAVTVILAVEALAVSISVNDQEPVAVRDLTLAAALISLSIAYSLVSVRSEGVRHTLLAAADSGFSVNLLAVWDFMAAALLPLRIAVILIVLSAVADWPARNIAKLATPYRYVYSTASTVLGACAVSYLMRTHIYAPLALVVGMVAYVGVSAIALGLAMGATRQWSGLRLLLRPSSYRSEAPALTIALVGIVMLDLHLGALIWLSLPAALMLQRRLVRVELHREAEPDERPMVEEAWQLVAREVVAASDAAAVMRIDTGDAVAVTLVARVQAGCDAIGQNGPNGLAILLTDCPGPNADAIAARMRSALQGNKIEGHVAVAAKPRDGQTLADLLAVSEAELIAMKAASASTTTRADDR